MQLSRSGDARQVVETALSLAPDNRQFRDLLDRLNQRE
jgi:hypothetical protein